MIIHYYNPIDRVHQLPESIRYFPRTFDIYYFEEADSYYIRTELISDLGDQKKMFLIESYIIILKNEELEIDDFLQNQANSLFNYLVEKYNVTPAEWPHQTTPEKVPALFFDSEFFKVYKDQDKETKELNTDE